MTVPPSDELLLESLGAALRLDVEPSAAEIAAVRELVSSNRQPVAPAARPRRPTGHVLRAAAVVAVIVLGLGGLVAALGTDVSPVLRPAARAIGISVDSDRLRAAKAAMASLEDALAGGDEAAIERGARDVVSTIQRLDRGDRAEVEDDAAALLARADTELRRIRADRVAAPGPGPSEDDTFTAAAPTGTASPAARDTGSSPSAAAPAATPPATPPVPTQLVPTPPTVVTPPAPPDGGSDPPESEPDDDDHSETEPGDD